MVCIVHVLCIARNADVDWHRQRRRATGCWYCCTIMSLWLLWLVLSCHCGCFVAGISCMLASSATEDFDALVQESIRLSTLEAQISRHQHSSADAATPHSRFNTPRIPHSLCSTSFSKHISLTLKHLLTKHFSLVLSHPHLCCLTLIQSPICITCCRSNVRTSLGNNLLPKPSLCLSLNLTRRFTCRDLCQVSFKHISNVNQRDGKRWIDADGIELDKGTRFASINGLGEVSSKRAGGPPMGCVSSSVYKFSH